MTAFFMSAGPMVSLIPPCEKFFQTSPGFYLLPLLSPVIFPAAIFQAHATTLPVFSFTARFQTRAFHIGLVAPTIFRGTTLFDESWGSYLPGHNWYKSWGKQFKKHATTTKINRTTNTTTTTTTTTPAHPRCHQHKRPLLLLCLSHHRQIPCLPNLFTEGCALSHHHIDFSCSLIFIVAPVCLDLQIHRSDARPGIIHFSRGHAIEHALSSNLDSSAKVSTSLPQFHPKVGNKI